MIKVNTLVVWFASGIYSSGGLPRFRNDSKVYSMILLMDVVAVGDLKNEELVR